MYTFVVWQARLGRDQVLIGMSLRAHTPDLFGIYLSISESAYRSDINPPTTAHGSVSKEGTEIFGITWKRGREGH